jgi:hypothetical protein
MPQKRRRKSCSNRTTSWLTLLTIHLDFFKRSCRPTFRLSLLKADQKPVRCSCSQAAAFLRLAQPGSVLNFSDQRNRPRFVLQGGNIRKAEKLCEEAAKSNGTEQLIPVSRNLASELVEDMHWQRDSRYPSESHRHQCATISRLSTRQSLRK